MLGIVLISLCCGQLSIAINTVKPWEAQAGNWWPNWMNIHEQLKKNIVKHKNDIRAVFLGASITNFYMSDGAEVWNSYYVKKNASNYGIPGDSTSNVLWRLENQEMDGLQPKVIVLSCGPGYNSMHDPDPLAKGPMPTQEEVTRGLREIIKQLRTRFANSKVIVLGMTPYPQTNLRAEAKLINADLKKDADEKNLFFLDITPLLTDSKGNDLPGLFKDNLHFTLAGFKVWHEAMKPLFEKLLSE